MSFPYSLYYESAADNISYVNSCSVNHPSLFPQRWIVVPIALLVPMIILIGFLTVVLAANKVNPMQVLANDLELILLAAFLLTGLVAGFLVHARRA